jgi:Gamma-glutamyl cyclotransferase, AIG2-like
MVAENGVLPRKIAVFFYGLFMDAELLGRQGLHPSDPRPAAVEGMALCIGQRATLVPNTAGTVHGMVMMLSHAEIDALYSGASVASYRPEAVLARLDDGSSVPALCFNLPTPPEPSENNQDYARQLAELGRRLGMPSDYLRSLGYDGA